MRRALLISGAVLDLGSPGDTVGDGGPRGSSEIELRRILFAMNTRPCGGMPCRKRKKTVWCRQVDSMYVGYEVAILR